MEVYGKTIGVQPSNRNSMNCWCSKRGFRRYRTGFPTVHSTIAEPI